jgi:Domain of unknown function (DUF4276)
MSGVAFLVDGHLEQSFINNVCSGKTLVRRIGLNGNTVATKAIAQRIKAQAALLRNCRKIVICLDLEDRKMTFQEFEKEIEDELDKLGIKKEQIIINVVDQMIENWILADPDANGLDHNGPADGVGGKGKIKKLVRNYHETIEGVEMLKKCRPSLMKQKSPSFDSFYKKTEAHIKPCWWLER